MTPLDYFIAKEQMESQEQAELPVCLGGA